MKRNPAHSGFMLLEIVVAVGLLVLGLAVIGAQVQDMYARRVQTRNIAREVFLAESKIAELETGLVEPEQEQESDFGRLFPEYGWRLTLEPAGARDEDTDDTASVADSMDELRTGLLFAKLEIFRDQLRTDPDDEFDFDSETAEVVQTFYMLYSVPQPLDLTTDFGMTEEVAEKLNEDLTGLVGADIDVHQFNPAALRDLDMETITEILPTLMQAFGMQQSEIMNLLPAEMRPQLEEWLSSQEGGESGDETGDDGGDESQGDESGSADSGPADSGIGDSGGDEGGDDWGDTTDPGSQEDDAPAERPGTSGRGGRGGGTKR